MFVLPSKATSQIIRRYSEIHLYFFRIPYPKFFSKITKAKIPPFSTVDYLVSSCGLSSEKALSAAKQIRVEFKTADKPDSVLRYLANNGFSKTQIARIVSMVPRVLCSNVDKTLKPKIKQFEQLGFSGVKLAEVVASNPRILRRSLKCQIVPSLEFLRSFVQTDENVIRVVKRAKWLFSMNPESRILPNIALLRDYNVPDSRIVHLIMNNPGNLMIKTELLRENIETIKKLGLEPDKKMFTIAIHTVGSMSKSTWDSKMKLLKSLGWSEEEIFHAFRKMPIFLANSEEKIKKGMDFFGKILNYSASVISKNPKFLSFSLKERIIPRFNVYQVLKSKELIRKENKLLYILNVPEKDFLKKYVTKYQDELPDLLKIYKGDRVNNLSGDLVHISNL